MKNQDPTFERSVCDYLDETLPESAREAFEERLRNDPLALDLFCAQAMLHAHLSRYSGIAPVWKSREASSRGRGRYVMISAIAAAAAIFLTAWWMGRTPPQEPERLTRIRVSPLTHFEVDGKPGKDRDFIAAGSRLTVAQGVIDLTLPSGTRAIVSAPAELRIEGHNSVRMKTGRGRFDVPKGAEGFVVNTDRMEVIDHGTKFTVDTFNPRSNRAEVVEGKIEVRGRGARGDVSMLRTGQAIRANADGTLHKVAGEPYRFLDSLPSGLPSLRFRLDPDASGKFSAEGSLARTARVRVTIPKSRRNQPRVVPGRFGQAVRFDDNHRFLSTTWPGIEGTMARSISFWMRADPDQKKNAYVPLLGWGLPKGRLSMSLFGLVLSGNPENNHLRITSGRRWLEGGTRLDDGEWHHVVVVLEGYIPGKWPVTRAYVDGKSESLVKRLPSDGKAAPLTSFNTVIDDPESVPLRFGLLGSKIPEHMTSQSWELDEVVIAAGALTESQIDALFRGKTEESGLAIMPLAAGQQ